MNSKIRRSPYALHSIHSQSVARELQLLLDLAKQGKLIGVAYVAVDAGNAKIAGRFGVLARDTDRAAGQALGLAVDCAAKV